MAATDPDPDDLTDEQLNALADRVADRLDDRLVDGDLADAVTSRRRDILKGLAGGGVAAALGYSATSSAAAGSNQVGTVGAPGNLVDVEAEDISAESVTTDELGNGVLFASEFATGGSGTPSDPYIDGVRLAVESTTSPHYVIVDGTFKEDPINVLEGAYEQFREGAFSFASVPLVGFGKRSSMIVLKDGSNDSLIKADIDASSVSIDENAQGPVLLNVGLIGNKDGQTGGPSHGIYCKESSGSPRVVRGGVYNIYVRWFRDDGLELANQGEMNKSTHIGVDASYQDGWAYRVPIQSNAHGVIARQSNRGVQVLEEGKMWGGNCVGNAERGAEIGTAAVLNGTYFENNNNGNNGDTSIVISGTSTGSIIANCSFNEDNVTYCVLNDGTETKFHNWTQRGSASVYDNAFNATRPIINGVGRNAGDPSSTGQWNGNGIEGVWVLDNSNDNLYLYRVNNWIQS